MDENWRKVTHSQQGLFFLSLSSSWLRDELQVPLMLKWWWCWASCPRMSVDILGTNCDQCLSRVQCCFTSTETVRLITTESPGLPLRFSHSSWSQRTADELQVVNALVETVLLRPAPWRFSSNTAVMSTKHVPTMFYKKPGTNALVRFSSNRRCIEFFKIWNKNDC